MNNHQTKEQVSLRFHGSTSEYFGIWIVNVLLSIVTLGIYSAWAKVRNLRYFYGNTELNNHRFNYLAEPLQILKGRIIAVLIFASYMFLSSLYPLAGIAFAIAFFFLTPFLICASLRFNSRMTSYQNVRFDFTGKYGDALITFILLPIMSAFTLYLALPWVLKKMDEFLVSNLRYGDKAFKPELDTGYYYKTALIVLAVIVAMIFIIAFSGGIALVGSGKEANPLAFAVIGVMYVILFTLIQAVYSARIRNHIFKNTELDGIADFDSHIKATSLVFLQLTNLLALICTFGLALPWVKIRTMHFFVSRTDVFAFENHQHAIDQIQHSPNALTEELSEVFDIDVALT
ncbi:YjgN family protein [Thalassotalea ganghwensis]